GGGEGETTRGRRTSRLSRPRRRPTGRPRAGGDGSRLRFPAHPRQPHGEGAAPADLALEVEVAAEEPGQLEAHAEAETRAAFGAGGAPVRLLERAEDPLA